MSQPEQDVAPGPTPPQKSSRPILLAALAAVVAIVALAAAFMLGRTTGAPSDRSAIQAPASGSQPAAAGVNAVGATPLPVTTGQSQPPAPPPAAPAADLLITDRLLANPPTYEEHQSAPTTTSVCLGESLRIANLTSGRLGLIDTPDESDASSTLGFVEPGAVFNMVVQETGTYFISAAGHDGLLFRYVARRCSEK